MCSSTQGTSPLCKAASSLSHTTFVGVPYLDFKRTIRGYILEKWQQHWSNLTDNFKLKSIRPSVHPWNCIQEDRRSSIVLTRLRIGHTYLTHRYLLTSGADRQAPTCSTCNVTLTVEHLMVDCQSYANERRIFNLEGRTLKEILNDAAPIEGVFSFLKAIGLFYDI